MTNPTSWARLRPALLALGAVRAVLAAVAVPLAPALYRDHYVVLVALRPTKDVLLLGGFLLRDGQVGLVPILIAAVPLIIGGVWLFYALGRAYAKELNSSGSGLPKWVRHIVSPERVKTMREVLDANGALAILGGRLSVFPSSVLAAAAGASDVPARTFLPLDGVGALLSLVEVLGVGYALGDSYERGSHWITIAGVVVFLAVLAVVGRWIRSRPRRRRSSRR